VVFLGFNIIAKTAIQKSNVVAINIRTIIQPNIYYTCPAGKVATVKGQVKCTGTGAASEARFVVAGIIKIRWRTGGIGANVVVTAPSTPTLIQNAVVFDLPVNIEMPIEFALAAGENFETTQNSGTNAEFNVYAEVTESPA